jgi:hypothetical protein
MYFVASIQRDASAMEQHVAWAAGKPSAEGLFRALDGQTTAAYDKLTKAREIFQRSVGADQRDNLKTNATSTEATAALWEAEYGSLELARRDASSALATAPSETAKILAALALAEVKDEARAEAIAKELNQRSPNGTTLNNVWLPSIRAQIAMSRILRKQSRFSRQHDPTSWDKNHCVRFCTQFMLVGNLTCARNKPVLQRLSSRKSSITEASLTGSPSRLWLTLAWCVLAPWQGMLLALVPLTRTSYPFGRMPILIFLS